VRPPDLELAWPQLARIYSQRASRRSTADDEKLFGVNSSATI